MSGVNKVIILGNLGNDPETSVMPNGNAVAKVSIATSEKWKKDGQENERPEWHRVVFFNKLAEIVGKYLKKGSNVYVEGQLRTNQWEKDGQKHYTTEIIAREMQMLDSKGDGQSSSQPSQSDNSGGSFNNPPADEFDSDIPF